MKCVVLACMGAMAMMVSSAQGGDDPDVKALQGTWLPASAEMSGQAFPEPVRKTMKLVIDADKYTVTVGEQLDKGTTKVDSTKSPKVMDIVGTDGPNKGKTILAIYELKEDTLRICYDLSGKARPSEFKTEAEKPLFLVTYKREKP